MISLSKSWHRQEFETRIEDVHWCFVSAFSMRQSKVNDIEGTNQSWWHLKPFLTHRDRNELDNISQTTFSIAVSWIKMYEFRLRSHWSGFLRLQLTISQHLHFTLQWRQYDGRDGISNHQGLFCFLCRLFRRKSKKISKRIALPKGQ